MLSITLNGGNGLLKAACGSCAAIGPALRATTSRLDNTLTIGFMLPPLRASLHLFEAQQLRDFLRRQSALFDRDLTNRAAGFVGLLGDGGGSVVADLRRQRG